MELTGKLEYSTRTNQIGKVIYLFPLNCLVTKVGPLNFQVSKNFQNDFSKFDQSKRLLLSHTNRLQYNHLKMAYLLLATSFWDLLALMNLVKRANSWSKASCTGLALSIYEIFSQYLHIIYLKVNIIIATKMEANIYAGI